ncbi:hypothetical protein N0Y54_04595 [Nostoc punctiforme UO1]
MTHTLERQPCTHTFKLLNNSKLPSPSSKPKCKPNIWRLEVA